MLASSSLNNQKLYAINRGIISWAGGVFYARREIVVCNIGCLAKIFLLAFCIAPFIKPYSVNPLSPATSAKHTTKSCLRGRGAVKSARVRFIIRDELLNKATGNQGKSLY